MISLIYVFRVRHKGIKPNPGRRHVTAVNADILG
jgi:hypothetical protein